MKRTIATWGLGFGAALAGSGCPAVGDKPGEEQSLAGWYMEHAEQGLFQRCGESRQWRVSRSAELNARAREFALDQDMPVYVRVVGATTGQELVVSRVEQFGSPTPLRDCGLTGVATPTQEK